MRIVSFFPTTPPDISLAGFAGYDPATSEIVLGDSQIQFSQSLNTVTAVPEPGTLGLLRIGLFGMGLARRRKIV